MTARIETRAAAAARPVPMVRRLYGLGSVFGKTVRDARRAFIVMSLLLAGSMVLVGAAAAQAFGTIQTRQEAAALAKTLPSVFQGMLGEQVGLNTLGGLIEWRYPLLFFLIAPIWSILALSGTLATEARQGSLEFLATSPLTRRRLALEKLLGHAFMVVLLMVVLSVGAWATGAVFGTLPGDDIPLGAAFGYSALVGLSMLAVGAIAFALAPFVGRGAAAGVSAVILVAMFVVNGYRDSVPLFDTLAPFSWYSWTANHIPLARQYDWPSLLPIAVIAVVLFAAGIVAFERRDVGSTIAIRGVALPRALLGVSGPTSRSFGERLPAALAWGIGVGLYAAIIATTGQTMADTFKQFPNIEQMIKAFYPDIDYTTAAGVLQLVFVQFATLVLGFAMATLVGGWASDESAGRLDVVLSAPLSRFGWAMRSGLGVYAAIVVVCLVIAAGIGLGAASVGSDAVTPIIGLSVIALYLMALAGIGLAVGGLLRPSRAAPAVAAVVFASFLVDLVARPLKLPDAVQQLALTSHLGQPMVGIWDIPGTAAWVLLAFGGLAVGAWGLSRRDLRD
jgi:ABC-2 type transport system permease protein